MISQFSPLEGTELLSLEMSATEPSLVASLRSTIPPDPSCPYCGGHRVKNGTRRVRFRDIPQAGSPVWIEWWRQKFICQKCLRASHDEHAAFDYRRDLTIRFVVWVEEKGKKETFTAIAKESGVNEKIIRRIFQERGAHFGTSFRLLSDLLSIELIELAGAHRPALIDVQTGFIVEVFKSVEAMEEGLADNMKYFGGGNLGRVSLLLKDIRLLSFGRYFPYAAQVVSPSSAQREGILALEQMNENMFLALPATEKLSTVSARILFNKKSSHLGRSAKRRLDRWKEIAPTLHDAYYFKEQFIDIWSANSDKVIDRWAAWKTNAKAHPGLQPFVDLIDRHFQQILNYYRISTSLFHLDETLKRIGIQDEGRRTHSFAAARAALLGKYQRKVR